MSQERKERKWLIRSVDFARSSIERADLLWRVFSDKEREPLPWREVTSTFPVFKHVRYAPTPAPFLR